MSKLLSESIVDAAALREAALKSAQQAVLEQHNPEVKRALKTILEQEALPDLGDDPLLNDPTGGDPSMGGSSLPDLGGPSGLSAPEPIEGEDPSDTAKGLPLAATEGEKLCACPDEEEQIEINFDELEKQMQASVGGGEELGNTQSPEPPINLSLNENDIKEKEDCGIDENTELEIDEELIRSLFEVEAVDEKQISENVLHAGESCDDEHPNMTHEEWEEQHTKDSKKTKKEDDDLKAASVRESKLNKKLMQEHAAKELSYLRESKEMKLKNSSLILENKEFKTVSAELLEENKKFKNMLNKLTKHLEEVNLSNARLLFTNQALVSNSLNERQKSKIVEAIKNAGSVDEVKLVYETLQNTVGSVPNKKDPKSLNEVVETRSSTIFPRREDKTSNPQFSKWAKLAGIIKKD